ncbi:MAG: hypothetical protein NV67_02330 [Gammaproteobacteria bacterium (ex Lamellibrachia satsuma)]|nr:MAG: hypothetical protein HPY30_13410 [Gammaproteobacteria bacterium (ex Lamellibrachia satsuma)]RRS37243.1 MAG: hypothetical protein NV67_02330 [Gammaproteobacteria bacterium (ex Lamellibrachia satsuma)]
MNSGSLGVVFQFTDCHVHDPESDGNFHGVDTNASLLACLAGAQASGAVDLLVFSGDLSNDESRASYQFLAESVDHYFPGTTCLIQAGNHDDLKVMQQVFPYRNCQMAKQFQIGRWCVYLLETQALNGTWFHARVLPEVYQDLQDLQLREDISDLLVFMHYNLVDLKFRGIQCGVGETDKLRQAMLSNGKVRCVSSGHIHQEYHWLDRGIIYTSTPTTGAQSRLPDGRESQEWAGFKRFELFSDGTISLDTMRICEPVKRQGLKSAVSDPVDRIK